jgi:ornithine cyclodeaminase/alanine dehydrogenase-like protein (mu-crystallin family)
MQNAARPGDGPILLLSRADVLSLLTWPGLIDAARRGLVEVANASTVDGSAAPGASTQVAYPGGSLHLKAGIQSVPPVLSVKANLRPHLGDSSGAILVFDLAQQRLQAIVASADVTALRTAAIAAVAAEELVVTTTPVRVAILGAGPVGRRVDEALAHLGIASEIRWWSRSADHAAAAIAQSPQGVRHVACDTVETAVAGAALVVTCTPARDPILFAELLEADAVILAMGADTPGKRELGPDVLETAAQVYADIPSDALQVGESAYLAATDAAGLSSLGSRLTSQSVPNGSRNHGGRVVFDSVGSSVVDAATVALLVDGAAERAVGSWIDLDGLGSTPGLTDCGASPRR